MILICVHLLHIFLLCIFSICWLIFPLSSVSSEEFEFFFFFFTLIYLFLHCKAFVCLCVKLPRLSYFLKNSPNSKILWDLKDESQYDSDLNQIMSFLNNSQYFSIPFSHE